MEGKWIIRRCNIIVFLASARNENFLNGKNRDLPYYDEKKNLTQYGQSSRKRPPTVYMINTLYPDRVELVRRNIGTHDQGQALAKDLL